MTTALGCHLSNPNGSDAHAMAAYESDMAKFVAQIGQPTHMNAFTDFSGALGQAWIDNAGWTAWSWSKSPTASKLVPVVGVPLSDNGHWSPSNVAVFQDIAAGKYDYVWDGIARAWFAYYGSIEVRPGYEHNGGFMPWFQGGDAASIAAFKAAWRQVATVIRATAKALGKTVRTHWNPASMQWNAWNTVDTFPGVDVCDVIGFDVYSPRYPGGLYDWSVDNGSYCPDAATWYGKPGNSEHFWNWPDATEWHKQGGNGGFGFKDALALCKQYGLPMSICETGAGNKDASTGPADDAAFPAWLKGAVAEANAAGVEVLFANVWATSQSDGAWGCLDGEQPKTVAAWKACGFGAAASAVPSGPAVAVLTDRRGTTATITITGAHAYYVNQTGLIGNVWVYDDGAGGLVIAPSNADDVPTCLLRKNGNLVAAQGFRSITNA